ncbi:MAG: hypothetical protein ABS35_03005 [Kaistia sp. SCN 65-12]|nr:MAG: hypothetical protein ABS35_03005 [Kaistia sp. SCN 65-12]
MVATFVAACLFALQAAAGAFTLGAGPDQASLDGFGNVICTHDGVAELPSGDQPQKHMPSCCVLGCTMGVPVLDAPPEAGVATIPRSFHKVAYLPATVHGPVRRPDWSPSNPRAPPAA